MAEKLWFVNLGCGKVTLPCERPKHHRAIPEELYAHPHWHNVDRKEADGVTHVIDLFRYPWPLESDFYEGAILSHIAEHIPHEIREGIQREARGRLVVDAPPQFAHMPDGWFAFFSELRRILKPGAVVHVLAPWALSAGALADPTHTRQLLPLTFMHSIHTENGDAPFEYEHDARFKVADEFLPIHYEYEELPDGVNPQGRMPDEFYLTMRAVK